MDLVTRIIEHLLGEEFSIDRIDSILRQLNISKAQLLQVINDDQYEDFFQILHPSNNHKQGSEKLALTLDLFGCTHYANHCKNASCPFLHLCPYNVRPMHPKCTNKNCPYDHDVLKSQHNQRIIEARGLSFITERVLHELTRASANPTRSFWVCNDYPKKDGCPKRQRCDKFHFCYYFLIDNCTKSHCPHVMNEECLAYFRRKDIHEQAHEDILDAFRKVLRQRKTDYISRFSSTHRSSSASTSPKRSNSGNHHRKRSDHRGHRPPSSSRLISIPSTDNTLTSKSEPPSPSPVHDHDILLIDDHDDREYRQTEQFLAVEIGCPIKLLLSKQIHSEYKNKQNSNSASKPLYYYCPVKNPKDIFDLLRWQNEENQYSKPLILYANVRDAHDAARQFFDDNQFCLLRVHLFHSGAIRGDLLPENRLQLNNSITMHFDRMWIYIYNF